MNRLVKALASGFGAGYAPVASGTFGTLVGMLVYLVMPVGHPWLYLLLLAALFALGVPLATRAERLWGDPEDPAKDDGRIVYDEIVGYLATMLFLPLGRTWIFLGFLVFRVTDILKIPLGKRVERIPGGLGVMLDDLLAGLAGCVILHLIRVLVA